MDTSLIRIRVEQTLRTAAWRRQLAELQQNPDVPNGPTLGSRYAMELFVTEYLRQTPVLVDAIASAADHEGLSNELAPLLNAAIGYWELEDDLIPDALGVLGLLDDAFLTNRLIERFVMQHQEQTGRNLLSVNLSRPNAFARSLFTPLIALKLEKAVETTLRRAELTGALSDLSQWGGSLGVTLASPPFEEAVSPVQGEDDPASGNTSSDSPIPSRSGGDEFRGDPAGGGSSQLNVRQLVRGNISLWALGLGVVVFKSWRYLAAYPADSVVWFGWIGPPLTWCETVVNMVVGSLGLSAVFTRGNLRTLVAHWYAPVRYLTSRDLQIFFAAKGTTIAACVFLLGTLVLALGNASTEILISPKGNEVVLHLRETANGLLLPLDDEGESFERAGESVRIRMGAGARLLLPGLRPRGLLLVRDQYDLTTVEALAVRRSLWRLEFSTLGLSNPLPAFLDEDERQALERDEDPSRLGYRQEGRKLEFVGELSFARRVLIRVRDANGEEWGRKRPHRPLTLEPATLTACPAAFDGKEVREFFEVLCKEREAFAHWIGRSDFLANGEPRTYLHLPTYRATISFGKGEVELDGATVTTREAVRIYGEHVDNLKQAL